MDSNDLLASTRVEFFTSFIEAMRKVLPRCAEELFSKANASYTSSEQSRLLNARAILTDNSQSDALLQEISAGMDRLLNRSFQTTYNNFRPTLNASFHASNLSLVDANAFEDELRVDDMTMRFRSEAEELLRDLNIRVALLFEQEVIKERENPFRPYLFARCIVNAVESQNLRPDITRVLNEQLGNCLAPHIASIYSKVNGHLAHHGIAAQLQFKIEKSPTTPQPPAQESEAPFEIIGGGFSGAPGGPFPHLGMPGNALNGQFHNIESRALSSDIPKRSIEQLFESVRQLASGFARGGAANSDQAMPVPPYPQTFAGGSVGASFSAAEGQATMPPQQIQQAPTSHREPAQLSWLQGGQSVGVALRKFFTARGAPGQDIEQGDEGDAAHSNNVSSAETQQGEATYQHAQVDAQSAAVSYAGNGAIGNPVQPTDASAQNTGEVSQAQSTPNGATAVPLAQSVQQLQRDNTPATHEMLNAQGEVRNLIFEHRAVLSEMAESIDDQMTIDVVAMLFEFILRDNQVPAEVRAQLGRLQFLVLKIALRDASLLTQKGHPARMLVNRIGSISLGLKQLDPSGVQITEEICRIVETLLRDDSENPQLFSKMLDEFDAFIARELRASDQNVERTVEVIEQAQNRTLRFARTVAQMAEALSDLTIDPYLQDFLENTWVHAIEMAERTDAKKARRYRLLVPDLLWSIVPKVSDEDRSHLFALLPIIVGTIREGLALINWDTALQQRLINWLVEAHTSVLRGSGDGSKVPALSAIHEHFVPFTTNVEEPAQDPVIDPKDVKRFLDDAIKQLDLQVQMLDPMFDEAVEDNESVKFDFDSPDNIERAKQQLTVGVSVEINLGGKPTQGRLNWTNTNLSHLVLTINDQAKPSIVGARMFRRMLEQGRVRFLESAPLFDRAVESLLKSADQIDSKIGITSA